MLRSLAAMKSSRMSAAELVRVLLGVGGRAAQARLQERPVVVRGLLAVEQHEAQLGRVRGPLDRDAARARARPPPPCRRPRRWRRRTRAAASCRSAPRSRSPACCRAAGRRCCAARGWPGTDSKLPRGSVAPQPLGEPPQPARPGRPRPQPHLAAQLGPGAARVEAVDSRGRGRRRGRGRGARRRRVVRAAAEREQRDGHRGGEQRAPVPRSARADQSFEVTASSSAAKRSRAAARRAGTCSLGTPSAGAA